MSNWKCCWGALIAAGIGAGSSGLQAQDAPEAAPKEVPFTVEQVVHPVISALPSPVFREDIVAMPMVVTSRSELAQKHVNQGLAYIQAGWDFEAYRHFCEAVRSDQNCMMAYWGIGLALAAPNNEFALQRMVAVNRMLDLMDATVGEDKVPLVTPMEREYALALARLFSSDAGSTGKAFSSLAEKYPDNLQAKCLAIYLERDGYNEVGDPLYGQEVAMKRMMEVLEEHPDNVAVMTFVAMLYAEAPDVVFLRERILGVVRKLVECVPDFPPYEHLLGHYEWRCGNHSIAESALEKASAHYAAHMAANKMTFLECDGWIRCRLYLATAMYSRGKFEEAMKIAKEVAALEVKSERLGSAGANLVVWEARTLPARLYAARGWKGDFDMAIRTLPGKKDPQLFIGRTLSLFYLEGLRQYLGGRRELEQGNREQAQQYREAMGVTGEGMYELQRDAMNSSSISEYLRAIRGLEVYHAELRGLLALASPSGTERRVAFNWFQSAVDKQQRPTLLMPPVVIWPMELRMAEYYTRTNELVKSAEQCQDALKRRPNDLAALKRLEWTLLSLGRKDEAAVFSEQIKLVTRP